MIRRNTALIAVLLCTCLPGLPNMATAQTAEMVARQTAGLDQVSGVAGDWQLSRFTWDEQRNDWSAAPAEADAGSVSFHLMGHGKAFRVTIRSRQYQLEGYLSFDVWTERHVLAVIDDRIGQLDVAQGVFVGTQLTLDNLKADTIYKRYSKPINTRTIMQFDGGKLKAFQVFSSQDHGRTWTPTSLFRLQPVVAAK